MSVRGVIAGASPLTVTLDGSDTAVPAECLASYTPDVDDRVWVDPGPPVIVLGSTEAAAWVAPTLGNSWVDFGGGVYEVAGYRKAADGTVMLRGLIKDGTPDTAVFTLPAGYRPPAALIFLAASYTGMARIEVSAAGVVQVVGYAAGGTNASVSLSGIRFSTTA